MNAKRVVVTGSLAFDNIMSMPGRFKDHILPDKLHILNVSFMMDTFRKDFGGTGGNQAYSLALLGLKPLLIASAGNDFRGYGKHLAKAGVDTSGIKIFKRLSTAIGFVTTDQDDNQIWGFYSGAMKMASRLSLKMYLDRRTFVVIAPNDPRAMVSYFEQCIQSQAAYLFDPAFIIPHFTKEELRKGVLHAEVVIGNDYEISLLLRKSGLVKGDLLRRKTILITTLGEAGSCIERKGKRYLIPPANPKNTSDPTGAGDAYRAGFMAGYLRGFPLDVCGRMGSVAAVYTIERYGTQTHSFSIENFKDRYKKNFKQDLSY